MRDQQMLHSAQLSGEGHLVECSTLSYMYALSSSRNKHSQHAAPGGCRCKMALQTSLQPLKAHFPCGFYTVFLQIRGSGDQNPPPKSHENNQCCQYLNTREPCAGAAEGQGGHSGCHGCRLCPLRWGTRQGPAHRRAWPNCTRCLSTQQKDGFRSCHTHTVHHVMRSKEGEMALLYQQ